MKKIQDIKLALDDGTLRDSQLITVDTETFTKEFELMDGYDSFAVCKDNGKVYEANFKGAFVELLEFSNVEAMTNLTKGLMEIREQLIKEFGLEDELKEE